MFGCVAPQQFIHPLKTPRQLFQFGVLKVRREFPKLPLVDGPVGTEIRYPAGTLFAPQFEDDLGQEYETGQAPLLGRVQAIKSD